MDKYYVYYGTEENGYEEEFLGKFETYEQAKNCVAENLADDFTDEGEIAKAVSEIGETGYEGENGAGYHILYLIGERDFCLSVLYGLREDFLEQFEDEDE